MKEWWTTRAASVFFLLLLLCIHEKPRQCDVEEKQRAFVLHSAFTSIGFLSFETPPRQRNNQNAMEIQGTSSFIER
jgi:hypothetical protein